MDETYEELDTAFTTADTIQPIVLTFRESQLTVEFSNFNTPPQKVVFYDVRAFSWSGWDGTSEKISPIEPIKWKDPHFSLHGQGSPTEIARSSISS